MIYQITMESGNSEFWVNLLQIIIAALTPIVTIIGFKVASRQITQEIQTEKCITSLQNVQEKIYCVVNKLSKEIAIDTMSNSVKKLKMEKKVIFRL